MGLRRVRALVSVIGRDNIKAAGIDYGGVPIDEPVSSPASSIAEDW